MSFYLCYCIAVIASVLDYYYLLWNSFFIEYSIVFYLLYNYIQNSKSFLDFIDDLVFKNFEISIKGILVEVSIYLDCLIINTNYYRHIFLIYYSRAIEFDYITTFFLYSSNSNYLSSLSGSNAVFSLSENKIISYDSDFRLFYNASIFINTYFHRSRHIPIDFMM